MAKRFPLKITVADAQRLRDTVDGFERLVIPHVTKRRRQVADSAIAATAYLVKVTGPLGRVEYDSNTQGEYGSGIYVGRLPKGGGKFSATLDLTAKLSSATFGLEYPDEDDCYLFNIAEMDLSVVNSHGLTFTHGGLAPNPYNYVPAFASGVKINGKSVLWCWAFGRYVCEVTL